MSEMVHNTPVNTGVRNSNAGHVNNATGTTEVQGQPINNYTAETQILTPQQTTTLKTQAKHTDNPGTLQYTAGKTKTKFQCTTQTQTIQANTINEGGDTTQTLAYGTTGSVSIIPPNPDLPGNPDTFCIGSNCTKSTGNQPIDNSNPPTPGDYANRYYSKINGTIEVTKSLQISDDENLCIGSKCGRVTGNANRTEFYGQDGRMDGPIEFTSSSNVKRGLVLGESVCIGSC